MNTFSFYAGNVFDDVKEAASSVGGAIDSTARFVSDIFVSTTRIVEEEAPIVVVTTSAIAIVQAVVTGCSLSELVFLVVAGALTGYVFLVAVAFCVALVLVIASRI